MRVIDWAAASEAERRDSLARPSNRVADGVLATVREIFDAVRGEGDAAVRRYTEKFDRSAPDSFVFEIPESAAGVSDDDLNAMRRAQRNIETFHAAQHAQDMELEVEPGVRCALVRRPLNAVGLYVPAGGAPLLSTLMMLALPAKIAGVQDIVAITPPDESGAPHPVIQAAARLCGLDRLYCVGGAQAIAALAFGTETIPRVDKIFGPGNAYVAAAKAYAQSLPGGPAIDLPAGPSEVMVIADETARADFIAADLLSQAEHDRDAQVMLVARSRALADRVCDALERQIVALPRAEIARASLENGAILIAESREEACEIANEYAPEHLILNVEAPEKLVAEIKTAGAVFVGPWSTETAGDYASGPNHVLPTDGTARVWSGVTLAAFQRTMTVQTLSEAGARSIGPDLARLARMEGLEAHARAAEIRFEAGSERQ